MKINKLHLRFLSAALGAALVFSGNAFAQNSMPVRIKISGEAASATGIVMSATGVKMKQNLSARASAPGEFIVDVPIDSDETSPEYLATAYIATTEGRVAFGEMTPVSTESPSWSMEECAAPALSMSLITANEGLLSSLVKIREQRIKVTQAKIAETLDGKYLERLRGLERALVGQVEPALGPDLPPLDLINRVNVILGSLKTREAAKKNVVTE